MCSCGYEGIPHACFFFFFFVTFAFQPFGQAVVPGDFLSPGPPMFTPAAAGDLGSFLALIEFGNAHRSSVCFDRYIRTSGESSTSGGSMLDGGSGTSFLFSLPLSLCQKRRLSTAADAIFCGNGTGGGKGVLISCAHGSNRMFVDPRYPYNARDGTRRVLTDQEDLCVLLGSKRRDMSKTGSV